MIYKFLKSNPKLSESAPFFRKPGGWADLILHNTSDEAKILRWQEADDYIVCEFDRHPGSVVNNGRKLDSFTFDKADKVLLFDMKKCFDSGRNEHPSATAERLKLICISFEADEPTMKVKMVVFDPFDNVPEWVTLLK